MLAAIQRKQALAHGVVKCTCKCNDLLFQLGGYEVDGVKKKKNETRRDGTASV